MTGKQHTAQNVGGPVISITTIRPAVQWWHKLSSRTVKPLICFSLFLFSFLFSSCSHGLTPEEKPIIVVNSQVVTCTQVWLTVKNIKPIPGTVYILTKNGAPYRYYNALPEDTVIIDTGLSIKTTYTYEFITRNDDFPGVSSNNCRITTLDTTSHNITWQEWSFYSSYGSSNFNDVYIVNENNIWVGGEIPRNLNPSNAYHWDGTNWEEKNIGFVIDCDRTVRINFPVSAITESENKDVIFWSLGAKVGIVRDTVQITSKCGTPFRVSANSVRQINDRRRVIAGLNGFLAVSKDTVWEKIPTGTIGPLMNICLVKKEGKDEIYSTVWKTYETEKPMILKVDENNKLDSLPWPFRNNLSSIYSPDGYVFYTAGDGLFNNLTGKWELETRLPSIFSLDVNGSGHNDLYSAGFYSMIYHFNGVSWKPIIPTNYESKIVFRIVVKGNLIAVCGMYDDKAYVAIGRRQ